MEPTSLLVAGALLLLLLPLIVLLCNAPTQRRRLPPGPPAVPLFGNLLWLRNSAADVEPLLLGLFKKYGPIALIGAGVALADRPRTATSSLLGVTDNIITRADYGPVWRLLRRNLVSETLHPSRVRLFAPARAWVRRVLMEKLREGDEPDVMEAFQYSMFCLLVLMCFGERLDEPAVRAIEDAERAWLIYISRNLTVFFFLPSVTKHLFRDRLRVAHGLRMRQRELFVPLIHARREYKKRQQGQAVPTTKESETTFQYSYVDTLLDVTIPEEGNRPLTDDEIVALCSEFLNAGTDTTSTGLQWIMAELVKNQAVQKKLYDEIKSTCGDDDGDEDVSEDKIEAARMPYLKAVILEGLRKHPPGHFVLPHKAAQDMEVGGYLIPKGTTVNFMVAEMGRDEGTWEKAMEFVPERFLEEDGNKLAAVDMYGTKGIKMMPFGVGRRICAGISIAMLHLEYFVANMVKEFEWKEVAGKEVDFSEKREFTTVMANPLRPRLVPRN
uniref:Uncharacterized protein n=1 Tax=Avena sativa TaxID=4498 RepID=A0ACD5U3L6_AVESA